MENILVVSESDDDKTLLELLKPYAFHGVARISNGSEIRRRLFDCDYDLIVINCPLPDEFGDELALKVVDSTTAGVLLVVKSNLEEDIAAKVEDYGVLVVGKPIQYQAFYQSFKIVLASRKRILGLKNENRKLRQRIEEIKIIDRAKCLLIQNMRISEQEAHRYIEKQAMDRRKSKREVAEGILRTMEI